MFTHTRIAVHFKGLAMLLFPPTGLAGNLGWWKRYKQTAVPPVSLPALRRQSRVAHDKLGMKLCRFGKLHAFRFSPWIPGTSPGMTT